MLGIDFVGLPDGKIILGGSVRIRHLGIEKYDNAGVRDTSFSKSFVESDGFEVVSAQKDGKVLLVSENTVGFSTFAARFDTFGNLDTSLGSGGITQTHVSHFMAHNIFEQSDGRVVVFGDEYGLNSSTFSAVRLLRMAPLTARLPATENLPLTSLIMPMKCP